MILKPAAVSLVLCELAIIDDRTRNLTAASCFSRRVVEGSLAFMPPFYIVATLVGGHGAIPGKLVLERLDTLEVTYERAFNLQFADPLQELTGLFRVRAHVIPVFGFYQIQLIADGESIAQKKFSIVPKGPKP
jgi:hypothetical protein